MYAYARTIIGYHGCDAAVAKRLLSHRDTLQPSMNRWDWLGKGIYFWEHGPDRALRFARDQQARGKVKTPVVIGAVLQLGRCLDLLDTRNTEELERFYPVWEADMEASGHKIPSNHYGPDRLLRELDNAVINAYVYDARRLGLEFDSVRGAFWEGGEAFPGSGIQKESHIQIAIRNPACIIGLFTPSPGGPS